MTLYLEIIRFALFTMCPFVRTIRKIKFNYIIEYNFASHLIATKFYFDGSTIYDRLR